MALWFECMLSCAPNLIDTADIVREAIFQQLCCFVRRASLLREQRFLTLQRGAQFVVQERMAIEMFSDKQ